MSPSPLHLALTLREEPFFAGIDPSVVARVEAFVYHRDYDPRQVIYFPDDSCDFVYWVREGRVKVTRVSGDGRELTFRHLLPGDMLGEDGLAEPLRRNDYAEAVAPTTLCLIRADDFRRVVAEEPELAYRVARYLCRRVAETEQVLSETVFNPVRSRVASGILRLYRRNGHGKPSICVTHQEVANLVGSTRETTTAVLHQLRDEGVVELANRRLTVVDPVALEHLASGG